MKNITKLTRIFIIAVLTVCMLPCMVSAEGTAKLTIEYYGEYENEFENPALAVNPANGWENNSVSDLMSGLDAYAEYTVYNGDNDFSNYYFYANGAISGMNLGYLTQGGTAYQYFSEKVESWQNGWYGALAESDWYGNESGIKFYIAVDGELYSGDVDMNNIEIKPWSVITIYISDTETVPKPEQPNCKHENTTETYTSTGNKQHTVTTTCSDCGAVLVKYTSSCSDSNPVYDRNTCTKTYTCACGYKWKEYQTANGEIKYNASKKQISVRVKQVDINTGIYIYIAKYGDNGNLTDITKTKISKISTTYPFDENNSAFVWYDSLKPFCDNFKLAAK